MSSSKEKIAAKFAKLGEYDKAQNRTAINVIVERKEIDGEPKLVFKCENYSNEVTCCPGGMSGSEKQPLKKEFTDSESFIEHLKLIITEIEKQL